MNAPKYKVKPSRTKGNVLYRNNKMMFQVLFMDMPPINDFPFQVFTGTKEECVSYVFGNLCKSDEDYSCNIITIDNDSATDNFIDDAEGLDPEYWYLNVEYKTHWKHSGKIETHKCRIEALYFN